MCLSSTVYLLSLVLVAARSANSLPLQINSSSEELENMSLEQDYLTYLFQSIEENGRQSTSNGELNLLPDDSEGGFANIVQCLTGEYIKDSEEITQDRRELSFNLKYNFMSSTQKLVAFHLVIPTEQFSTQFTVKVYESNDSNTTTTISGRFHDKYIDLHVDMFDQPNHYPIEDDIMYNLVIEVTNVTDALVPSQSILQQLKPMLVVYSYDNNLLENLFQEPLQTGTKVVKRDVQNLNDAPTSTDRKNEFCQVHSANLTSFPWINERYEVLFPDFPTVTFCDGHCKLEGILERGDFISRHGKMVGDMDPRLIDSGIARCCIPKTYSHTPLKYRRRGNHVVILNTIDQVTSCHCY